MLLGQTGQKRGSHGLEGDGEPEALGPDELPVELLKLGLNHYPSVIREFGGIIKRMCINKRYRSGGDMP